MSNDFYRYVVDLREYIDGYMEFLGSLLLTKDENFVELFRLAHSVHETLV